MLLSKMIVPWFFVFMKTNYHPLQKQAFPNNYLPQHRQAKSVNKYCSKRFHRLKKNCSEQCNCIRYRNRRCTWPKPFGKGSNRSCWVASQGPHGTHRRWQHSISRSCLTLKGGDCSKQKQQPLTESSLQEPSSDLPLLGIFQLIKGHFLAKGQDLQFK